MGMPVMPQGPSGEPLHPQRYVVMVVAVPSHRSACPHTLRLCTSNSSVAHYFHCLLMPAPQIGSCISSRRKVDQSRNASTAVSSARRGPRMSSVTAERQTNLITPRRNASTSEKRKRRPRRLASAMTMLWTKIQVALLTLLPSMMSRAVAAIMVESVDVQH